MALTKDQLNKLVKLQLLQTFKELSDAKYLDKTITAITGLEANTVEGALAEIFGKVSVTGDYNDLSNKPVLIQQLTISSNTSSTCSITGSSNSGKEETIIYANSGSSDVTVTVPTTYKTPDGAAIELTCPAGGYCEVSYLNISSTIYARGL